MALTLIAAREPLLPAKLSGPGARPSVAAELEPGMRAYAIGVNDISGVGGHALPGDRVDVVMMRNLTPNGPGKVLTSQLVVQNVRVLGVDLNADPTSTKAEKPSTTTLEVSVKDAQKLAIAAEMGSSRSPCAPSAPRMSSRSPRSRRPRPAPPAMPAAHGPPARPRAAASPSSKARTPPRPPAPSPRPKDTPCTAPPPRRDRRRPGPRLEPAGRRRTVFQRGRPLAGHHRAAQQVRLLPARQPRQQDRGGPARDRADRRHHRPQLLCARQAARLHQPADLRGRRGPAGSGGRPGRLRRRRPAGRPRRRGARRTDRGPQPGEGLLLAGDVSTTAVAAKAKALAEKFAPAPSPRRSPCGPPNR
uniref:Flp pilus assembly protein CpaB n=1 Tax=Phenylobacterium glaciei TaxID=2803784 RepID=A0A974P241_9CAUL|nr:Flp pilus assembly protein CpaB [Phenylobacterium glaciei]